MRVSTSASRSGKSHAAAVNVAKALRDGDVVFTPDSESKTFVRIIGVPGYPDGRQLTDG